MSRILPAGVERVSPRARGVFLGLLLGVVSACGQQPNVLTPAEKSGGWQLLFDGATLSGWRGFRSAEPPAGWRAVDGALARVGQGGDLMTVGQFSDFELHLEWKVAEGGNSGIMFHVTGDGAQSHETGPEFQVLDNASHADGKAAITSAGSNYALHPPARDVTKPVGEWNEARLIVKGAHVEHWMNDVKLLEYELWSTDWEARVTASKFAKMPRYGRAKSGHLVLQDHGDAVSYRNIKIKAL